MPEEKVAKKEDFGKNKISGKGMYFPVKMALLKKQQAEKAKEEEKQRK